MLLVFRHVYFLTASSIPGPAFARSAGAMAGCISMRALKARTHGSATAGICETSCISKTMNPVLIPSQSQKYAASGLRSASIAWIVLARLPFRDAAFAASTGNETFIKNRIQISYPTKLRGGANRERHHFQSAVLSRSPGRSRSGNADPGVSHHAAFEAARRSGDHSQTAEPHLLPSQRRRS